MVGIDVEPVLKIKVQYRWALVFAHLRDYAKAAELLKDLKKLCNIYEQFDLWHQANKLFDWTSAVMTQQEGKFRLKTIIESQNEEDFP